MKGESLTLDASCWESRSSAASHSTGMRRVMSGLHQKNSVSQKFALSFISPMMQSRNSLLLITSTRAPINCLTQNLRNISKVIPRSISRKFWLRWRRLPSKLVGRGSRLAQLMRVWRWEPSLHWIGKEFTFSCLGLTSSFGKMVSLSYSK